MSRTYSNQGSVLQSLNKIKAMVIMSYNHYTVKVSSKNIHSPLTPVATDIRARRNCSQLSGGYSKD